MEEDKNQNNYGNSEVGIKKIAMNDELTVSTIFLIFIPERRKNLLKSVGTLMSIMMTRRIMIMTRIMRRLKQTN